MIKTTPIFLLSFILHGCIDVSSEKIQNDIEKQVVNDSIEQYEIAKKHGELADICVQAGLVAAAQLQAKDELGYKEWKKIEQIDCNKFEQQQMKAFQN